MRESGPDPSLPRSSKGNLCSASPAEEHGQLWLPKVLLRTPKAKKIEMPMSFKEYILILIAQGSVQWVHLATPVPRVLPPSLTCHLQGNPAPRDSLTSRPRKEGPVSSPAFPCPRPRSHCPVSGGPHPICRVMDTTK